MNVLLPFSQLTDDRRREAAALLFAHIPNPFRSERIEQFLSAVASHELNPATILTIWLDNCIVGVQVVEILAGNFAALWTIRSRPGANRIAAEDALLDAVLRMLRDSRVRMVQCLVHSEEESAADLLRRQGFRRLTSVRHMRSEIPDSPPGDPANVTFHPYEQCDPFQFQQSLMRSFEETLDCPELNDLRTADEILAGHRAASPDLSRWWMIRHENEPAGLLILADAAYPELWDLAYLGVLPESRRKGIGRAAVNFALRQAGRMGKRGLSLMVDERNQPALHLYEHFGFHPVATRDVYVHLG